MDNKKNHKDMIFHKINFKNAKRFKKMKSSKEIINLLKDYNEKKNNENENNFNSSALNIILKNIDDKFSICENKNLVKANKRINSTKKDNFSNISKNYSTKKNFKKNEEIEMEKIDENKELNKISKNIPINKNYKKSYSCKKLKINKSLFNPNKDTTCLENDKNTKNSKNLSKNKKRKIMKKKIRFPKKIFIQKEKAANDGFQKRKNENYIKEGNSNILCCL